MDMATIEYLTKRVEGKTKEIAKLEKKLERIHKAEATGWEVNPYYYDENDLRWTLKDLESAKEALAKYEAELTAANEKAQSRNVEAILKFLEMWQERMKTFFVESLPRYEKAYKAYCESEHKYYEIRNSRAWWELPKEERKALEQEAREGRINFRSEWAYLDPYLTKAWKGDAWAIGLDMEKLTKDLKKEADEKYDDIIERTNAVTGKITDASGLSVGAKGELNGYIIGEKGTAKVSTIGAGGYNIQCFHFRTLIHRF